MLKILLWPKVYVGLVELLGLGITIYLAISLKQRWLKNLLQPVALALVLIAMRRHNVELPVLIAFFYMNSFFFLGSFFGLTTGNTVKCIVNNVVFGMLLFALVSLLLSVFNWALDYVLFAMSMVLSIMSFFFKGRSIPSVVDFKKLKAGIKQFPLFAALFAMVAFMLVFQTNNVPGFDEFWYSLRPGELLNRHGSFFEKIIYPNNWVAYYPKLTDVLIYPLLLIPNYAVAKMFSVACWGMVALLVFSFLEQAIGIKRAIMLSLLIITIPALGVMAVFTKGEVLALLIFLVAYGFMDRALKHKNLNNFILALVLVVVATTARLSALMFAFIFIVYFLFVFFWKYGGKGFVFRKSFSSNALMIVAVLLVFLLYYRTYSIVGIPVVQLDDRIPFIQSVYSFLGFEYHDFLRPLEEGEYGKIPFFEILINSIFRPFEVRAVRAWFSNFYLLILLIFCFKVFSVKGWIKNNHVFFAFLLIAAFWFSTGVVMANDFYTGGDGNYFLVPVILSSLLLLREDSFRKLNIKVLTTLFILYFPFHFCLTMLRGPNRDPGTMGFNITLTRNPLKGISNFSRYHNDAIRKLKIWDIEEYLPDGKDSYIAGTGVGSVLLYKLGCSAVHLNNVEHGRKYIFETYETYKNFLKETGINYLIQPNNHVSKLNCSHYFWKLKDEPGVLVHEGEHCTLLDLREAEFLKKQPLNSKNE